MFRRLRFELRYLFGNTPWDTQESPPELVDFLRENRPGRAIDMGCGTGTNVLTMAELGWEATGVDLSRRAIAKAREKAARSDHQVTLVHGNVLDAHRLPGVKGPYDLALDLGCFHTLERIDHEPYIGVLAELLRTGGTCLLYSFLEPEDIAERSWPSEERILTVFSRAFEPIRTEHGEYHDKKSAWFTWQRSA